MDGEPSANPPPIEHHPPPTHLRPDHGSADHGFADGHHPTAHHPCLIARSVQQRSAPSVSNRGWGSQSSAAKGDPRWSESDFTSTPKKSRLLLVYLCW